MDLKAYLTDAERGTAAAIARVMGVHPVMVSQWASGEKPIPVDRAAPLERATHGNVRRWDSRPLDWHIHWPELKDLPEAPDPIESLLDGDERGRATSAA